MATEPELVTARARMHLRMIRDAIHLTFTVEQDHKPKPGEPTTTAQHMIGDAGFLARAELGKIEHRLLQVLEVREGVPG